MYSIQRANWVAPGDTVVVIGPGAIGIMATQCSALSGASKVIMLGTRESRLNKALEMGATHAINIKEKDAIEEITRLTGGKMADLVIEASGTSAGAAQSIDLVRKNGRVALVGIYHSLAELDVNKIVQWNVTVVGSKAEGEYVIERAIAQAQAGLLKLSPLITHKFDLDDINKAFDTFINRIGGALKVIITM
jgi:threonine dehydrogenase-like Zn-dependent dehydrogenase